MTTSTRSHNQIAFDGVRVAWHANGQVASEEGTLLVRRSMDGVVRVCRVGGSNTVRTATPRTLGTLVLKKWTGAIDGVRVPRLGLHT